MLKYPFLILLVAGSISLNSCMDTGRVQNSHESKPLFTGNGYRFYRGVLGNDSARLDLVIEPAGGGQIQLSGCLHLKDGKAPVYLFSGLLQESDSLWSLTSEEPGFDGGNAVLEVNADGSLHGMCSSVRGKNQRLRMFPAVPEGLNFQSVFYDSSYTAFANRPHPLARFACHFLQPEQAPWLSDSLLCILFGDSLRKLGNGNPVKVFEQSAREFKENYRAEVRDLSIDTAEGESLDYCRVFGMEVFLNTRDLLSLSLNEYQFYGGAHGLLASRCMSFDMKSKKRIRLEDVFKTGFRPRLSEELSRTAKTKYKLTNLTDLFFAETIEPGENYYLLENGICFSYYPYEIAPFVAGEPSFYLPFSQLKDILKN